MINCQNLNYTNRIIRRETRKIKKKLYENWDGYDYYDGEYIKNNIDHINCPSIDHKISIQFGFINNIPVEEIYNINNLCITKLRINSIKNYKTEKEFKK